MKLQRRIHLYSSALFAVLLLAASLTVYWVFSYLSYERELDQLEAEALQASSMLRQTSDRASLEELLRAYVPLHGMIAIVTDRDKPIVVTSSSETELRRQAIRYQAERYRTVATIDGHEYGFVTLPYIGADGEVANLQVTVNLDELVHLLRTLRVVLLAVTAAAMVPAVLSNGLLGSVIVRPISSLTRTMREIARSGKFMRIKLKDRSKDELQEMGETFNEMISLLESTFAKQEQFVSNASHELRTPLTIIESYASLLRRRGLERPELFNESIEAIHSEAVRMKGMTEQLLLLATPEQQWTVTLAKTDITQMTEQAVASFRNAYGREIHLVTNKNENIYVQTDEDKLKQLVFILLDNARKYSESSITVIVAAMDGEPFIRVMDQGIGIPAEDLPHVFDRFYRVDKARSREDGSHEGGTGLGLSLAKEIAAALQARIILSSVEGEGTSATIYFQPQR